MPIVCDVCELPDPFNGAGDGVISCGCLRAGELVVTTEEAATDA